MKVIDLLNKIANGEEVPKKFQYEDMIFIYNDELGEHFDKKEGNSFNYTFDLTDTRVLNDEVQIIEDTPEENKNIENFKVIKDNSGDSVQLVYDGMELEITLLQAIILDKINEIIDKVNGE